MIIDETEAAVDAQNRPVGSTVGGINEDAIWRLIERHITHRWPAREVIWIVAGPGVFRFPLADVSVDSIESSPHDAFPADWQPLTPRVERFGYWIDAGVRARIVATVGRPAGELPEEVAEAFFRLAGYLGDLEANKPMAGVTRYSESVTSDVRLSVTYAQDALGNALVRSGAADLLRPWRRINGID